jgi:hypothetical protein
MRTNREREVRSPGDKLPARITRGGLKRFLDPEAPPQMATTNKSLARNSNGALLIFVMPIIAAGQQAVKSGEMGLMRWRVKMSKFLLLTVCAFGLLLSSPLAQEKSLEQLREERSHIFGIEGQESQTINRVIASGAKQRIGFYVSLNPDCTATGDVNVRVTKQPEHGTVETVVATDFVHYSKATG